MPPVPRSPSKSKLGESDDIFLVHWSAGDQMLCCVALRQHGSSNVNNYDT